MNASTLIRSWFALLAIPLLVLALAALVPADAEGAPSAASRRLAAQKQSQKNAANHAKQNAANQKSATGKSTKKHHKKHHKHHKKHHKGSRTGSNGESTSQMMAQIHHDENRLNRDVNRLRKSLR